MKNTIMLSEYELKVIADFKNYLKSGKKPLIVLHKVSKSGMRRWFRIHYIADGEIKELPSSLIKKLEGKQIKQHNDYFVIDGCGMDMALALLMYVYRVLGIENSFSNSQSYNLSR